MNPLSRMRVRVENSTKIPRPNPHPINGVRELLKYYFPLTAMRMCGNDSR